MKKILLLLTVAWGLFSSLFGYQYQLAVTAIFKDEGLYLKEWIEYYRYMGVEHFWLYNNNSSDNFREVLAPYMKSGLVELIEWPSITQENEYKHHCYVTQPAAFTDALDRARGVSKWLALIDLDEFIFPIQESSIIDCLEKRFYFCPGVTLNWQNYGTSHVEKIPENLHIWDALVYRMPWNHDKNKFFKSIVQPEFVKKCKNPHWCEYIKPYGPVDTHYQSPHDYNIHTDVMVINHYWARDEWFFYNIKLPRYIAWGGKAEDIKRFNEEMNQVFDNSLSIKMSTAPFLPK